MRIIFGALSLLIAVAVVAMLAKKQYGALAGAAPAMGAPTAVSSPLITPQEQSQQLQNQVKKSVEAAMQQPRSEVDD